MEFPKDLRYTEDHEWARESERNGARTITVGVSAFAVEQLGDITLVDLPAVGAAVKAGATFGTVESVKSVSDLYAPISGTVVAVNERLADAPELLNDSPYGDGWLVEIEPSGDEFDRLLDAAAYAELVKKGA